jgi:hypothetical protein
MSTTTQPVRSVIQVSNLYFAAYCRHRNYVNRLRVFESRVPRRIFGHKRENTENCITRSFIICTFKLILLDYNVYFTMIRSYLLSSTNNIFFS